MWCIILCICRLLGEPCSAVSMVTDYGLGDWGSVPNVGRGVLLYPLHPASSGAHPASYNGYRGSSLGVNVAGACC
jgi:hypothetical protein